LRSIGAAQLRADRGHRSAALKGRQRPSHRVRG
jgi:hypothetical protein